jgi:hypothetical protein
MKVPTEDEMDKVEMKRMPAQKEDDAIQEVGHLPTTDSKTWMQ